MITVVCPWCEAGINILKDSHKCKIIDNQELIFKCFVCKNEYYITKSLKSYEGYDLKISKRKR